MQTNKKIRYISYFLLLLIIAVYYPGLQGGFHFDDYPNIVNNPRIHLQSLDPTELWEVAWGGQTGGLKRPLSVLTFSLNTYFTGLSAPMMKITNLVIHMLNGLCIIYLANLLFTHLFTNQEDKTKAKYLSLLVGAIWMLHPLQLTGVLYIVQRMTSLATLFSLLAILSYCKVRIKQLSRPVSWLKFYPVGIFAILSLLSKEIAILIPLYLFCIEIFIFKFSTHAAKNKHSLYVFYIGALLLPIIIGTSYLLLNPEWLSYSVREFTLIERLMTETRVVMGYLKAIIIPNITNMGLTSGDTYPISKSLLNPVTTLLSGLSILGLVILGIYYRNKLAFFSFGIFWFFSGHALESTILPLEIAFEHRNYLPSFGIIFTVIYGLFFYFRAQNKARTIAALCIIFALLLGGVTYIRANYWQNPVSLAIYDAEHHPDSARANLTMGGVYQNVYANSQQSEQKQKHYELALHYFQKAGSLSSESVAPAIATSIMVCIHTSTVPEENIESIAEMLKNGTLSIESAYAIIILADRLIDGTCKLPSNQYFSLVNAALDNEGISAQIESRLLFSIAEYHDAVLDDFDNTLKLTKAVIDKSPNDLNYKVELINLYFAKGKYKEAQAALEQLEVADRYGFKAATIKKAYKILNRVSIKQ